MNEFELFYQAAENMDQLIDEGVFGDDAKNLNNLRDKEDTSEYFYQCLMNIFSDAYNTYGMKNTIGITFTLVGLISEAIDAKGQEAVDVLSAFLKGTKDVPELESLSAYNEYLFFHTEYKNILSTLKGKTDTSSIEKKRLGAALLTSYSKGVELVGKSFTYLLTLVQMINDKPYDLISNYQKTTYQKTSEFVTLANDKYLNLTSVIDRNLRNADSHLNVYFSVEKQAYIMKKTSRGKGGKIKHESYEVPWKDMVLDIAPRIGWFIQGFISACILTVLVFEDKEKYKQATQCIMDLNNDPKII